ncbi:MAG: isoleucine--tRNA ligase [Bacteroidetes bacterium]|nr:isoleucine--tRNA ligase [Bacteroidota bacterium]
MFKELTDKINYSEIEKANLHFWDENKIFEESISSRSGKPLYTFYEGPPTANGRPGIHHVMARTLKDAFCRYKTMSGFQVHRKAGWDTHGLPVEIEVEKQIGIKHKDEILDYGVEKFNQMCRESVWKYKTDWEKLTREMGYWVDLNDPYVTFENNYIESIWWALKQYYSKEMIYRGYKIQPYCPRCETPLSSHEVALGYKDVKDPSVYIKMKLNGEENTYFLVWTTTPWTLIANVALAVHPEIEYVKVELLATEEEITTPTGEFLILAKARLEVLKEKYSIVSEFKGKELLGKEYGRLFNYHQVSEKGWYVVEGSFVTTDSGSGIVHMAPAYGEDDYQTCRKYGLPTIHPVNKSGEFEDAVTDFKGKFVKDADAEIINYLKSRSILYKKEQYLHSYPHCWRCSSPLLYYARTSWYISTTKYVQRMIDLNKQINWIPKEVGEGRFGNWLEENKDWALSRDRYWGTPLPIWLSEDGKEMKCVGSFEELVGAEWLDDQGKPTGKNFTNEDIKTFDPHKPTVDRLAFKSVSGTYLKRTPELIDVWFDSGAMPFAQWHYPFENTEIFDKAYPADFISEGIDQTRGWFYTLHSIGSFLFDKPAYKNVLVNELILDKSGQKMSKSKGNTVDPFGLISKYGADATRWYLVSQSPVWRPTLFDEDGIVEVQRKFFSTLVNTYSFFALYANIDGFDFSEPTIPIAERAEIDRWIISSLNSLVKEYRQYMNEYDLTKASRAISDFTLDNLSNWYVRRNRRRFWKSEKGKDKTAAYQTLYECLDTIVKLTAPIAPFLADEMYRNLNTTTKREKHISVHLAMLPEINESAIDPALETRMDKAIRIVGLVRAMRMKSNLKVRQPLLKILVPVKDQTEYALLKSVEDVILDEINVKVLDAKIDQDIIKYKIKPNFRVLGNKYGKSTAKVAEVIRTFTAEQIGKINGDGAIQISVEGNPITIVHDDVEIVAEEIKGWIVESDGKVTVALDTEITPALRIEGYAREFVSRIQNLRKDSGFEVTDRISIVFNSNEELSDALLRSSAYIMSETLSVDLKKATLNGGSVKEDINGVQCEISIFKV